MIEYQFMTPEIPDYAYGLQIVRANDITKATEYDFSSPDFSSPLGILHYGCTAASIIRREGDEDTIFLLSAEGLEVKRPSEIKVENLYVLGLYARGLHQSETGLVCDVVLPSRRVITSEIEFDIDEVTDDFYNRNSAMTKPQWLDRQTGINGMVLLPPETSLLSDLRVFISN